MERPDERSIMIYITEFIRRYPAIRDGQNRVQDQGEITEKVAFDRLKEWCQGTLISLRCMTAPERPTLAYFEVSSTNFTYNV